MERIPEADSVDHPSTLRPLACQLSQLSRPDGDATLYHGDTCATVAVYGPGEVRMNKELLDKATVEVIYKPKSGLPGCPEKMFERTIRNSCETVILANLHPRSSISIVIQEMQDCGSFLSCCINAACLALQDASVSMKFLMASVSCVVDADGEILLDPTKKQEKVATASFTFVFENSDYNLITVSAKGSYTDPQFQRSLKLCQEASKQVFEFYRQSMEKKLIRSVS